MVIVHDQRILAEQRAVIGRLDVALDRHQPFLAHLGEQVVEQAHELHVQRLGVLGALAGSWQRGKRRLVVFAGVADDEGAERGAADHQQFDGLEQGAEMPAASGEAAEHGHDDQEITEEDQHARNRPGEPRLLHAASCRVLRRQVVFGSLAGIFSEAAKSAPLLFAVEVPREAPAKPAESRRQKHKSTGYAPSAACCAARAAARVRPARAGMTHSPHT